MVQKYSVSANVLLGISDGINRLQIDQPTNDDTIMEDVPVTDEKISQPMSSLHISPKPQLTPTEQKSCMLWRHIQKVQHTFNSQPYTGEYDRHGPKAELLLAKGIKSATDLSSLDALSLVIRNDRPDIESDRLEPLAQVDKPILRLHCTGMVRRKDHDVCAITLIEAFLTHLKGKQTLQIGEIAVSWDHRSDSTKRNEISHGTLSLEGDMYQLPVSSFLNAFSPHIIRTTEFRNFANVREVPASPARPRLVVAKTDGGLRGIVRLEACQTCVAQVPTLVLAVRRIMAGALLPYKVEDPFNLERKRGLVEYTGIDAE